MVETRGGILMTKLTIKDRLGDYLLIGEIQGDKIQILFNSRQNATMVKEILEWEAAHPNEAIPYNKGEKQRRLL